MGSKELETPVLVVGGGPIGLTLAMDLAWRGVEVLVVERRARAEPPPPKCNHVAARTMEIFRRLGVAGTRAAQEVHERVARAALGVGLAVVGLAPGLHQAQPTSAAREQHGLERAIGHVDAERAFGEQTHASAARRMTRWMSSQVGFFAAGLRSRYAG